MSGASSSAPAGHRRTDPAAIGSAVLAVCWPVLAVPLSTAIPRVGRGVALAAVVCACWLAALVLGLAALIRRRRAVPPAGGRWLAIAGVTLTIMQIAIVGAFLWQCTLPSADCFHLTF